MMCCPWCGRKRVGCTAHNRIMHVHVLVKGVVHVKAARPTVLSLSFAQPLQLVVQQDILIRLEVPHDTTPTQRHATPHTSGGCQSNISPVVAHSHLVCEQEVAHSAVSRIADDGVDDLKHWCDACAASNHRDVGDAFQHGCCVWWSNTQRSGLRVPAVPQPSASFMHCCVLQHAPCPAHATTHRMTPRGPSMRTFDPSDKPSSHWVTAPPLGKAGFTPERYTLIKKDTNPGVSPSGTTGVYERCSTRPESKNTTHTR